MFFFTDTIDTLEDISPKINKECSPFLFKHAKYSVYGWIRWASYDLIPFQHMI